MLPNVLSAICLSLTSVQPLCADENQFALKAQPGKDVYLVAQNIKRPPAGAGKFVRKPRVKRITGMGSIRFKGAFEDINNAMMDPDPRSDKVVKPYLTYRPTPGMLVRRTDD